MTSLAAGELFVLALAMFGSASALLWSGVGSAALRRLALWEPTRRHTATLLLALAPAITTALLTGAALAPSFLSLLFPGFDHCLVHDDGHAHLCFRHLPRHAPHALLWVAVASAATWVATHALFEAALLIKASLQARTLLRTGVEAAGGRVIVLDGAAPFCAAVGLLVPRVVISRRLLSDLTGVQREALMAHELSHQRRRDALARVIAGALSWLYPAALRRRILQALELAAEQACDEAAGRVVGDRLTVAETILRVERALMGHSAAAFARNSAGMQHSSVEQRVQALLAEPARRGSLRGLASCIALVLTSIASGADDIHHAVESFLSPLLH